MKKTPWRHLKSKWFISILVLVLIGAGVTWAKIRNVEPQFDSVAVALDSVTQTVSVTGTVSPFDKTDLAFQKGGVVSQVLVKVGNKVVRGQVLARLESSNEAAALESAKATLADMSRTLSPEEMAVQETAIANATNEARNASQTALVRAQSAVFNNADTLFNNPQSANPTIAVRAPSWQMANTINSQRVQIGGVLNKWMADLAKSPQIEATELLSISRGYVSTIKDFIGQLLLVVNDLNTGNSGLSQAQINTYIASINTALSTVNSASDIITAAETSLSAAKINYELKLAGNSAQSIAAQAARVAQAQAAFDQTILVSAIDGVITRVTPSVGEFIPAGQSGFTVQNDYFKIEAYVTEADIAKVSLGDMAKTTLDAYGPNIDFPAQVISIDPAETVIEGVPTYKVTLVFIDNDERVRSGMTANLDIVTDTRSGVLTVPYRAVIESDGIKTVRKVSADGLSYESVPVVTGLRGSSGTIEIVSGLSVGDRVVTYVK